MKEYTDQTELNKDYPEIVRLVSDENRRQYPQAKMTLAKTDGYDDFVVLFNIGIPEQVLYCTVGGNFLERDGAYIDEYYLVSDKLAEQYIKGMFGDVRI